MGNKSDEMTHTARSYWRNSTEEEVQQKNSEQNNTGTEHLQEETSQLEKLLSK